MRTKLLVVCLLAFCFVVGLGARVQSENKQWEYQTEDVFTIERANQLGQQGWELVTAVPSNVPYHVRYIFKRAR